MHKINIDFEWGKNLAGYRFKPSRDNASNKFIVPIGKEWEKYYPLKDYEVLYKIFAEIESLTDVLDFIKKFGPLTKNGSYTNKGDDVAEILEHAQLMRSYLRGLSGSKEAVFRKGNIIHKLELPNIQVALVYDHIKDTVRLKITPQSLLHALWLQMAQAFARGASLQSCQHCGTWFETGSGTGRRLDAKFCSDAHRIAYNSQRRTTKNNVKAKKRK